MSVRSICRVLIPACALAALLLGSTFALGACAILCRNVKDGWNDIGGGMCYRYDEDQARRLNTLTTAGTDVMTTPVTPQVSIDQFKCATGCTYDCTTFASSAKAPGTNCPATGQTEY